MPMLEPSKVCLKKIGFHNQILTKEIDSISFFQPKVASSNKNFHENFSISGSAEIRIENFTFLTNSREKLTLDTFTYPSEFFSYVSSLFFCCQSLTSWSLAF